MVWLISTIKKTKTLTHGILKISPLTIRKTFSILILLTIIICSVILTLPFVCLNIARQYEHKGFMNRVNYLETEKYYQLAIDTSLIPSVKAEMYGEFGSYYFASYNGPKAITQYEKDYNLQNNSLNKSLALDSLCLLYLYKDDFENIQRTCIYSGNQYNIARAYMMKKNYNKACDIVNKSIENNPNTLSKYYMLRANLYRKLGNYTAFKKDYLTAVKKCSNAEWVKKAYNNENYFEEELLNLKQKFQF